MAMTEKIKIACIKRGVSSERELAQRMGDTPQNLNNKMKRDNFKESELQKIADALGLTLVIKLVDPETGEEI